MEKRGRSERITAHAKTLRRHPWLTLTGLFLVAIIVLVCIWDWNWFKGPI